MILKGIFRHACFFILIVLIVIAFPLTVSAKENPVYDNLQDRIQEEWEKGMDDAKSAEAIEIKGSLSERILRSLARYFYGHLTSIKAVLLFVGFLSVAIGIFIFSTARLNKRLKRFAISVLIFAIPIVTIILFFGIFKFVSVFI